MNNRDHNGGRPYTIPVWNGILERKRNISPALWEFLWCVDRTNFSELCDSSDLVLTEKRRRKGVGTPSTSIAPANPLHSQHKRLAEVRP